MLHNVCSSTERVVRVVIGLALLSLFYFIDLPLGYIGLVGLVPIATAIFKYCPVSHLLGVNTCPMKQHNA